LGQHLARVLRSNISKPNYINLVSVANGD